MEKCTEGCGQRETRLTKIINDSLIVCMLEVNSHSTRFGALHLILDQSGNLMEGYLFLLIQRVFGTFWKFWETL